MEESNDGRHETTPPVSKRLQQPERIIVLHSLIQKKYGVKMLKQTSLGLNQQPDPFANYTHLQPFIRRRGAMMQLILKQVGNNPELKLNPKQEKYRTFNFMSTKDVTMVTVQLKEPYAFVCSIQMQLQRDKFMITYPCSTLYVMLSQTHIPVQTSHLVQFNVENTAEMQKFYLQQQVPCVRFVHLFFVGLQQTNPISRVPELRVAKLSIHGICLNFVALHAMKARNASRVYYQLTREALVAERSNVITRILQHDGEDLYPVSQQKSPFQVRPAVTTIASLTKIIDAIQIVALQHQARRNQGPLCGFNNGAQLQTHNSDAWMAKWL